VISPTVTSVSIEELEVELSGNIPHTFYGPVAKFNKELEAGYNYTLVVELKETRWAGSNIYYSDSHLSLRFDKAGSRINEAIQGVYFRWGSLVGIAPDEEYFSSNTALYYSTSNDGGYTGYESSWDDIPHIDVVGEDVYSNDREDRYLIDDLQNTPAMWSAWKGDICQYIGSYEPDLAGYRLPTSAEFGGVDEGNGAPEWDPDDPTTKSVNGWVRGPVAPDFWGYLGGFLHNGMTRLDDYYGAINLTANGYFPAAGRYGYITSYGTVRRYGVGNEGSYWSGSAGPKIDGGTKYLVYGLWFVPDGVNPFSAWDHFDAYPIRCIKRLPGELP
jgi:hypothetical protein